MKVNMDRILLALNNIERYLFENDYFDVEKYVIYMVLALNRRSELAEVLSDDDIEKLDELVVELLAMLDNIQISKKEKKKNMRKVPIVDSMKDDAKKETENKKEEDLIIEEGEYAKKTIEVVSEVLIQKLSEEIDTEKYGELYYIMKRLRYVAVKKFGEDKIKKIEAMIDSKLNSD